MKTRLAQLNSIFTQCPTDGGVGPIAQSPTDGGVGPIAQCPTDGGVGPI
jgi:hypothetical protein